MSQAMVLVGATGMLWAAVEVWHESGHALTLVARDRARVAAKMAALAGAPPPFIEVDYHDGVTLRSALREVGQPVDCVVAWVHGSAPDALDVIVDTLRPVRVIHVLGSAASHPAEGTAELLRERYTSRVMQYQQVVLGFARCGEEERTRWLTHAEISRGVLDAYKVGAPMAIVGEVEPWSDRP